MHDRPTAAELVEAVREYLERDVMTQTEGRVQFHARVASNVLATVQRELELGPELESAHRARLVALFARTDDTETLERELAAALRDNTLSSQQLDEATDHIRATLHAKLSVSNPKYLKN